MDIIAAAPAGRGNYAQLSTGAYISSGAGGSLAVGFNPRRVTIINETQGTLYQKLQGNSPATCLKNGTVDSSGLILFPADAGLNEPGSAVLLAPSIAASGDKVAWAVEG